MPYRVLDLTLSDEDFDDLLWYALRYESGTIRLRDFMSFARRLMRKYGRKTSDIWRYEYAVIKGWYEAVMALILATLRFRRPIRIPGDWKHYDYHWIQVLVFTISSKWKKEDVTAVSRQIIDELPSMWNAMGGGVTFVEEYSIYDPPEVLTEKDGFTGEHYEWLKDYLAQYDGAARNPANWENYTPPVDFRNEDHILSHYIACGIEEERKIDPEWDLIEALLAESPCLEGEDFPVSESLTVYAGTDISQRCVLWKKSGWRRRGAKYIPPAGGLPPERPPGRPRKREEKKEAELPTTRRKKWRNPLKGYDVYAEFHPKFWDTLRICQRFSLNPIPLRPNSKIPAVEWRYLVSEPIRPEHLKFFKDPKYNIGIMAGYSNVMIVDLDVPIKLDLKTLADRSPRGYHYYFKVDRLIPGIALKIKEGKCEGKSPLGIKSFGYVVAPRSTYKGKTYEWVYTSKIRRVSAESLVGSFTRFFETYYETIKGLFEPQCMENEEVGR